MLRHKSDASHIKGYGNDEIKRHTTRTTIKIENCINTMSALIDCIYMRLARIIIALRYSRESAQIDIGSTRLPRQVQQCITR